MSNTKKPTKPCIACSEEILATAKLCKHCQTRQDSPEFASFDSNDTSSVMAYAEARALLREMGKSETVLDAAQIAGRPPLVISDTGDVSFARPLSESETEKMISLLGPDLLPIWIARGRPHFEKFIDDEFALIEDAKRSNAQQPKPSVIAGFLSGIFSALGAAGSAMSEVHNSAPRYNASQPREKCWQCGTEIDFGRKCPYCQKSNWTSAWG